MEDKRSVPYYGGKKYIFLSYAHQNREQAFSFVYRLQRDEFRVWYDEGIDPGTEWADNIAEKIENSNCFLALISKEYIQSENCRDELSYAHENGIKTLLVFIEDVELPSGIKLRNHRKQQLFYHKYLDKNVFFKKLYLVEELSVCRLNEEPAKISDDLGAEEVVVNNEQNIELLERQSSNGDEKKESRTAPIEKQTDQNDSIDNDRYFYDHAVMEGSVLQSFNGRLPGKIVIPEGVTVIGARAFSYYPELSGISIPSSVSRIEEYAFSSCPKLSSITVSSHNPIFRAEGNCCIEKATNRLVFGCCTSQIPDGVVTIGKYAFSGCENLTTIIIPSSVACIEECAFFHCTNLKNILISEGVSEIGYLSFCSCSGLVNLVIPASVNKIADHAFYGCDGMKSIQVSPDNSVYYSKGNCCIEINSNRLIFGCPNSTIPNGIVEIVAGAFGGCKNMGDLLIPNSVTKIGEEAFCECKGLKSIIIPEGVEKICDKAFMGCSEVKEIVLPSTVSEIADFSFTGCSRLKSIRVSLDNPLYRSEEDCLIRKEDNVLVLGCMNSIIPDGVTEIGNGAFSECHGLTDIYLPNSITKIGDSAFDECSLTYITIPKNVKYIGEGAFWWCNDLLEISIPNSVKYIGELAFAGFDDSSEKRTIFCEASKKPARWHKDWTDEDSDVYWRDEWSYDEEGNPMLNSEK